MQYIQNIPNPNFNSNGLNEDFGSHERSPKEQDEKAKIKRLDLDVEKGIPIPNEELPVYQAEGSSVRDGFRSAMWTRARRELPDCLPPELKEAGFFKKGFWPGSLFFS